MILRRVADAIREQNWFTVIIELVIVVAGILIAVQIDDWNQSRQDREREQEYLVRMYDDLNQSILSLGDAHQTLIEWNKSGQQTLRALMAKQPQDLPDDAAFGLQASTRIVPGTPQFATVKEIISAGDLNLISNAVIRAEISRVEGRIELLNELNQLLVGHASTASPVIQSRLTPVPESKDLFSTDFDFEALASDPEFINTFGYTLRLQTNNISWVGQIVEELKGLRQLIANEIGKTNSKAVEEEKP